MLATCFPCEFPIGADVKKIRVGRNQLQVLRQHPTLYDLELVVHGDSRRESGDGDVGERVE